MECVIVLKAMGANNVNRKYAKMIVLKRDYVRMEYVYVIEDGKDKIVVVDIVQMIAMGRAYVLRGNANVMQATKGQLVKRKNALWTVV